jgi:hypothetical protein
VGAYACAPIVVLVVPTWRWPNWSAPARALSPPGSMIAATVRAPDMAREPGLPAEGQRLSHAGIRVRWIAQMARS